MLTTSRHSIGNQWRIWIGLSILAAILAACEFPARDCDPGAMPAPVNLSPSNGAVIDRLTPSLTWQYWGDCDPEAFALRLYDENSGTTWSGAADGATWRWTPPVDLQPASHYWWDVTPVSGSTLGAISSGSFRTGPLCSGMRAVDFPAPVPLRPADGTVIDESYYYYLEGQPPMIIVDMVWQNPAGCLPPDGFSLEVSRDASFPPGPDTQRGWMGGLGNSARFFLPPGMDSSSCEPWYWRVAAEMPDGGLGAYSEVWTFYVNPAGLICPPELLRITPVIPLGPPGGLPLPETPLAGPTARVVQNARCRSGPGILYPLVTFVSQGQSFPIQGRNASATWWWIDRPAGDCWLADSVIETEGDTGQVPEQQAPPTPTVTPVLGCWQQPNLQYPAQCVVPCPPEEQNPSYCVP
jgi:hypothetical protein